ncbi:MAG: esterase/lipase family protein [Caldimonas sp.]
MTAVTVPRPTFQPRTSYPPPARLLQWLELRVFSELFASLALMPVLDRAPSGDGHPVLVLPGLIASDASTKLLRSYLGRRGYATHGWGLGRNMGLKAGLKDKMVVAVRRLHQETGRKVSIVGWSLGGVYARELAAELPEAVRSCIMLGSPIHGHPRSTNAWRIYEMASGHSVDDPSLPVPSAAPPPVPTTAIFSRTDGVVAWQCSREPRTVMSESIEVEGSHCGLGAHPAVLFAIADRLAQPEGAWQPFDRSGLRALIYPDPYRPARR